MNELAKAATRGLHPLIIDNKMAFQYTIVIGIILSTTALQFEMFVGNMCALLDDDLTKYNTSYHGCLNHCKDRAYCVALNFKQKTSLCRLNLRAATPGTCQGYVYSRKNSWTMDGVNVCGCPYGKRCEQNGECVASDEMSFEKHQLDRRYSQKSMTEKRDGRQKSLRRDPSVAVNVNGNAMPKSRSFVTSGTGSFTECDKLAGPDNGRVFGTRFSIGDKVSFSCNPGYVLNQTNRRVCSHDGTWNGANVACIEDQACTNYLISGPEGVRDEQLSDSGYWCKNRACDRTFGTDYMAAKNARINATGRFTGAWCAEYGTPNEYIQVDFLALKTIAAVVLQGRDPWTLTKIQYVTKFKVLHSLDCQDFIVITDANGDEKEFEGTSSPVDIVTRYLPERVRARCVRLNPTEWVSFVALRFDVLGC